MVNIKYKPKEDFEKERALAEKRKEVKGLAKKTFGFFVRVGDSISSDSLVLSTLFNVALSANLAVVNVDNETMRLIKSGYELKVERFAYAYQKRFGKELLVSADYFEPKK